MSRILLILIRAYQFTFSAIMGLQCRYHPTCSHYTAEAVRRFGAVPGLALGVKRICRCHPWGGCGHDPVPESFPRKTRGDMIKNPLTQQRTE